MDLKAAVPMKPELVRAHGFTDSPISWVSHMGGMGVSLVGNCWNCC